MEAIAAEFGANKSLYDVLETHSGATAAEIKKAYFKIALKCVSTSAIESATIFARKMPNATAVRPSSLHFRQVSSCQTRA